MYDTTSVIADVDFRAVVDHLVCEFKAGVQYDGATAVALLDGGCPVTQVGETKKPATPRVSTRRPAKTAEEKAAAKVAKDAAIAAKNAEAEAAAAVAEPAAEAAEKTAVADPPTDV